MRITRDPEVQKILYRLIGSVRGEVSLPHQAPQDLNHFEI